MPNPILMRRLMRGSGGAGGGGGGTASYLLRDEFSDTLPPGSVNGTIATPGPGTRTVVDTYATTEMVLNPGMEAAGATPPACASWVDTAGDGAVARTTTAGEFRSGAAAVKITSGATSNTLTSQAIAVIPGYTYNLSLWARGDLVNAGQYGIYDVTNAANIIAPTTTGVTAIVYAQVTNSFVAPAGCVSIQIRLFCPPALAGIAYFDDISLLPTTGLLSISGGTLNFAGGKSVSAYGDPGLWETAVARVPGRMLISSLNIITKQEFEIGFDLNTVGDADGAVFYFRNPGAGGVIMVAGNVSAEAYVVTGLYSAGVQYQLATVLRATGSFMFIRGGIWTTWSLITIMHFGSQTPVYPAVIGYATPATLDFLRVPSTLWLPPPLASDGFSLGGLTDGLGHAEGLAGGIGAGGANVPWAAAATWSVAGGVAINTPVTEMVLNPGFEIAGATPPACLNWSEGVGGGAIVRTIAAGEFHSGVAAIKITRGVAWDTSAIQLLTVIPGFTYNLSFWARGDGTNGGTFQILDITHGYAALVNQTTTASINYTQYTATVVIPAGCVQIGIYLWPSYAGPAGNIAYFDDVSLKPMTELVRLLTAPMTPDVVAIGKFPALTANTQAGIVIRGNDPTTPTAGIYAYFDGLGNIKCTEFSAAGWTQLFTAVQAFAVNDSLQLIASGANIRLIHITSAGVATLIGSTAAATVTTGGYHGLFSTDSGNTITDFAVWPVGTGNEHSILDRWSK